MAFIAPALPLIAAVGTVVSAGAAVQQGMATRDMYSYRAQVAKNNQLIAEQNADAALKSGMAKASTQAMKGAATAGRVRTTQAASGVDVNTGSAVDVQEGQREAALLDVETVLHNADLQAYGYRVQGTNFDAESRLDKAAGEQAETQGYLKGAGNLLSGASSLGFKWSGTTPDAGGGDVPIGQSRFDEDA